MQANQSKFKKHEEIEFIVIAYEYPFNEKMRMLLRLEDLYTRYIYFFNKEDAVEHHIAVSTIFDMLEVVGRSDLKSDLLQELERQKQMFNNFRQHPDVQIDVVDQVLSEIERTAKALAATQGKTGQSIRENEWLMSIRGRVQIPGGACEFDLPSYYAWQQKDLQTRKENMDQWFTPFKPLFNAISLVLRLFRDSGVKTPQVAKSGNFQQKLQDKVYQLLRIEVDPSLGAIPEASASKYMLLVRFTTQEGDSKPKSLDSDVPFQMTLC